MTEQHPEQPDRDLDEAIPPSAPAPAKPALSEDAAVVVFPTYVEALAEHLGHRGREYVDPEDHVTVTMIACEDCDLYVKIVPPGSETIEQR